MMLRCLLGLVLALFLLVPMPASAFGILPRRVEVVQYYYATPAPVVTSYYYAAPAPVITSYSYVVPAPVVTSYSYTRPAPVVTTYYYRAPIRRAYYAPPAPLILYGP